MKQHNIISFFLVPLLLFLVALLIFYLELFNKLMFPNPLLIIRELFLLFFSSDFYFSFIITLSRVICGAVLSIIIGAPLGLLLGYVPRLYSSFEFVIDFCRSIPATALFPLFMLFFGVGNISKIMISAWVATFIILVNTSSGVMHANKAYFKMARIYNLSKKYIFFHIVLPAALPSLFSGVRVGVSLVLIVVIVTEMFIGSVDGLGNAILNAQLSYNITEMYALIIITGLLGYVLNNFVSFGEKRYVHWTERGN